MSSSLVTWLEMSRESGTQIKAGARYQQATPLGITGYPFIHEYPGVPALSSGTNTWTCCCSLSVSGGGVVFCLSGATCARPFCAAVVGVALYDMPECLPLHVHDSMCTSVSESGSTARRCIRVTDYRKALGFARGSFWFL